MLVTFERKFKVVNESSKHLCSWVTNMPCVLAAASARVVNSSDSNAHTCMASKQSVINAALKLLKQHFTRLSILYERALQAPAGLLALQHSTYNFVNSQREHPPGTILLCAYQVFLCCQPWTNTQSCVHIRSCLYLCDTTHGTLNTP